MTNQIKQTVQTFTSVVILIYFLDNEIKYCTSFKAPTNPDIHPDMIKTKQQPTPITKGRHVTLLC